jgi:hypothetical protein
MTGPVQEIVGRSVALKEGRGLPGYRYFRLVLVVGDSTRDVKS